MKNPVFEFTRTTGAAALLTLIAACGSGGGDSSDGGGAGAPVPPNTFRITCTVIETVNLQPSPVDNALVLFNVGDKSYNATTGADGKCGVLDVPAAEVAGLTEVAASVVKDGYEPAQFTCKTTDTTCNGAVVLVRITANTSLPVNGDVVTHTGDGQYQGEINSKLQTDVVGASADFTIADWGTKLQARPEWTQATVVLEAKGWQTTIAPFCKNTVAIIDAGGGSQVLQGQNSPTNGEWDVERFTFDVATIGKTGAARLQITSGNCGNTADIDDVEVNRIRVYYCDATGTSCAPTP